MPANYSTNIVYLSKTQYQELLTNQTITVNGTTVNYNANDIYVTPQAEPITDVKLAGTSIGSNGVANIPYADSTNSGGIVRANSNFGIAYAGSGLLSINCADDSLIKAGSNAFFPIVPYFQHYSTFYGLSKVAGVNLANETVTLGIYPDASKAAIQKMLGISSLLAPIEDDGTADAAYTVGSLFTSNGKLYKATAAIAVGDMISSGTNCSETTIATEFVKNSEMTLIKGSGDGSVTTKTFTSGNNGPYSNTASGIGSVALGFNNTASGNAAFTEGSGNTVTSGGGHAEGLHNTVSGICGHAEGQYNTAASLCQHVQGKYNIADSSSQFADIIGNGTADDARSNAYTLDWSGNGRFAGNIYVGCNSDSTGGTRVLHDVKIGSNSIVSNGVATIPVRSNVVGGSNDLVTSSAVNNALGAFFNTTDSQIQEGTQNFRAIAPLTQHKSVFYGLAKAAGDTTMASSANAIGTYTTEAKTAIQSMIGVESGVVIIATISGTTPSITGLPNYRYICGEVSTLSVTPPANGTIIVRFDSGSTATVLTVPNTVKWPEWFDATSLETDVTYEIMITDGVYGAVMSWA